MGSRSGRGMGAAVWGLGWAMLGAVGEASADRPPHARPGTAAVAGTFYVDQALVRELPNGCRYEAVVRGQVRRVSTPDGERLLPDLQIRASLHCRDGRVVALVDRRLRRPQPSALALASAVEARAEVLTQESGRSCAYSPRFAVVEGRLRGESVSAACSLARGGGPR